jgi:hypothetical protein
MTAAKYLYLFGGLLLVLAVLMAAGVGVLFLLLNEAGEDGEGFTRFPSLIPFSFPFGGGEENEGNGFTGQAAGWLFGIACVPVVFSLAARFINRRISLQSRLKGPLDWFTRLNKKYFLPFHTYLSVLALGLAIVHLVFSNCPNPLPEWGLIGAGILVLTGLIIKLRIGPKIFPKLTKWIYQFHASLVVSGILISILFAGHLFMD